MEKVAMTWTFPLILFVSAGISVIVVFFYFLVQLLNLSGTFGACIYLFDKMKLMIIDRRLRKLVKEDEKKHKFDEL